MKQPLGLAMTLTSPHFISVVYVLAYFSKSLRYQVIEANCILWGKKSLFIADFPICAKISPSGCFMCLFQNKQLKSHFSGKC